MTKQLLDFFQNHWMLCSSFIAILGIVLFEEFKNHLVKTSQISVQKAIMLLNHENALVIDLRNQKSFADGHILGSIHIPGNDLEQHLKKLEPHKNKTLILLGDTDANALTIETKLKANGFSKIYILNGGTPAWKDAQLPLTKI